MKRKIILFGAFLSTFILLLTPSIGCVNSIVQNKGISDINDIKNKSIEYFADNGSEVEFEICGLKSNKKFSRFLSNEQITLLKTITNKLQNDLLNANLFDEQFSIFQNLLDKLIEMDLINYKQSTELNNDILKSYNDNLLDYSDTSEEVDPYNLLCFIAGFTNLPGIYINPFFATIIITLIKIGVKYDLFEELWEIAPGPTAYEMMFIFITVAIICFGVVWPIAILNFADYTFYPGYYGKIVTVGLLGIKSFEGRFLAQMLGFTGIKFIIEGEGQVIIGFTPVIYAIHWNG
jgi:hypothetical protein